MYFLAWFWIGSGLFVVALHADNAGIQLVGPRGAGGGVVLRGMCGNGKLPLEILVPTEKCHAVTWFRGGGVIKLFNIEFKYYQHPVLPGKHPISKNKSRPKWKADFEQRPFKRDYFNTIGGSDMIKSSFNVIEYDIYIEED